MMPSQSTILMTGSNGYIGAALDEALSGQFTIAGLDRDPPKGALRQRWIETDMASEGGVQDALETVQREFGPKIASVIHLAAYYDFSGEPSDLYDAITVKGTGRLLRLLKELKFEVEQFAFSSTMLVHAPCEPGQHIDEDWPLEPKWDYPQSKLEAERLLLEQHASIPIVLMRIAGVYDNQCHSIPIARQMQRIYERRLTGKVFPGDTSTGQSFVHLVDLVDAVQRVVERRATLPTEAALLIGEPEPLSYEESQRLLGWLIHGEAWETKRIPKAMAKAGAWVQDKTPGVEDPFIKPWMIDLADDHYALDITRARQLLNWQPHRTLRETIPAMVDFLKSDPAGFYEANKLGPAPSEAQQRETTSAEKK